MHIWYESRTILPLVHPECVRNLSFRSRYFHLFIQIESCPLMKRLKQITIYKSFVGESICAAQYSCYEARIYYQHQFQKLQDDVKTNSTIVRDLNSVHVRDNHSF